MIWVKTILFTILVPGTVTIFLPYRLSRSTDKLLSFTIGISEIIGLVWLGLGVGIYVICAWDFAAKGKGTPAPLEPPKRLVSGSLYKYSRNPMYMGVISILIGESFFLRSLILGGYTVLVFICFHLFVRYYEEPTLCEQFGTEYIRYCRQVPRWLIRRPSGGCAAEARRFPDD